MQKISKLDKYVIELDELQLPCNGKVMTFSSLKQFLTEAELAEQPVFRMQKTLYFFDDHDVAMIEVTGDEEKLISDWDKRMVDETNNKAKNQKKKTNPR